MEQRIWSDDPNVPYKSTSLAALYTKSEIDGLLAKWSIKRTAWNWEPEANVIFVEFEYQEDIEGMHISQVVRLDAPLIWDHRTRGKAEEKVHWNISMRVLFWITKALLEKAYLWQSNKTTSFLAHIATGKGQKDILVNKVLMNMEKIKQMPALAHESAHSDERIDKGKAIDV